MARTSWRFFSAFDLYLQDDALIDGDYLEYMGLAPLEPLGRLTYQEAMMLEPWVMGCKDRGLLAMPGTDILLPGSSFPAAIALLEQIYREMTGRALDGEDRESPSNPFLAMHGFLRQARAAGKGIIWLGD